MTAKRSLRLSVTDDLYRQIERTSRTCGISIAKAAVLHMAAGAELLDALSEENLRKAEL